MSVSKSNRCPAPLCAAPLPPNGGLASQHALLSVHLPKCADPTELLTRLHPVEDALGLPHSALPQPAEETKTPDEWAALDGVTVQDPDGWRFTHRFGEGLPRREHGPQDWDVPVTRQEWDDRLSVSSVIRKPTPTKAVQKWADTAMFTSVPQDASTGPEVSVLSFSPDPLGEIASAVLMYQGKPVKALSEITREERLKAFAQVQATKLKAPFEFVKMHLLFSNVTRSWTHQLVRQRTAAYAQESLRFAVVEDGFSTRVALPPSLAAYNDLLDDGVTRRGDFLAEEFADIHPDSERFDRLPQHVRWYLKWRYANLITEKTYQYLVNDGMPAEDARGLLPHNITTRVHYTTDLRALVDHAGNRLCTQAQFEWRTVFIQLAKAVRNYNPYAHAIAAAKNLGDDGSVAYLRHLYESERWQFEMIADLFRPACYLTGKCEFAAQDLDRKCSIRDRVDANHAAGRPSSEWADDKIGYEETRAGVHLPHQVVEIPAIHPREWLADPGAAR